MIRPWWAAAAVLVGGTALAWAAPAPSSTAEVVAEVRRHSARYLDVARAREDGYVQTGGMLAHHGIHFVNPRAQLLAATVGLDLARPPMLLYVERDGDWRLAGVEYALTAPPGAGPIPPEAWRSHEASCHYRDDRELAAARIADCPLRHPTSGAPFVMWHPALAVAHVWAWIDNPAGPFAPENAALAPWGGSEGHRHQRTAVEAAYSTLNHRVAGSVLLAIAVATAWEAWRPRRFPWSVLSAPLWMAFSVYLFLSVDPEAWPVGPGTVTEALADPLVVQHKVLSAIPMLIGVIHVLGGAGWLRSAWWAACVPALAVLGGAWLFVHSHHGAFHLDRMFLHHAAMGAMALAGGGALLLARRTAARRSVLGRAWPVVLAVMALLLLVYSEG